MKTLNSISIYTVKKSICVALVITTIAFSYSCQKYLDVKQKSRFALLVSPADAQKVLDNYDQMNTNYPSDGEGPADDYYLTDDSYNTLGVEDRQFYTWAANAQRSSSNPQWINPYKVVYISNHVLEAMAEATAGADATAVNTVKGETLFFRAYAFYQVAQLFCKPYTAATASTDLGIPLRLKSDINEKSVRSTVKETYDQITGDLQTAANLLPETSSVSSRPNRAAAYAFLARTYLAMGDYDNAGNAANQCLQLKSDLINYNTLDASSATPFIRFNKEVIFQSVMAPTAYDFSKNPYTVSGAMTDPYIAKIDPALYASYADNDLRKTIFFKENADPDVNTFHFSGNYDASQGNSFFDGLATDEIYLIRAECFARKGDATSAMADLNTLLQNRWATGTYTNMTASSADDALAKILTERRKELILRGLRWTDLRRLNMDSRFQVTLSRTVAGQTYTLPPNDPRYVQLIPADVIANSTLQQNPR